MSDTEEEPFDKEAEKKRLRQQLAEEEADRESTQRMSELLLQGATMTNRHCDQCGDPLFRHEGREFCPTCGRERAGEQPGPGTAAEAAGAAEGAREATNAEPAGRSADGPTEPDSQPGGADSAAPGPGLAASAPGIGHTPDSTMTGEADLPAARAALARKVTALAREAEATNDVGRARELLAAVREGAEALRALDGARQ